jgi:cytochrome c peroxidase
MGACAGDAMGSGVASDDASADAGHSHAGHFHGPADAGGRSVDAGEAAELFEWELPPGFPVPRVPADNPVTAAKVELGRALFYDERLSGNGNQSCGSCHLQQLAFTDGRAVGIGSTGQAHVRGAMSLANVAYASSFTWANATLASLEDQALVPLFGESPVELGLVGAVQTAFDALRSDPQYEELFALAFPDELEPISLDTVVKAIATFERALVSGRSPYDRYTYDGEKDALSEGARRGMALFFSERLECFHCHGGFAFAGSITHVGKAFDETTFHNNGLYNVDGKGGYPADNRGLYEFTGAPLDVGRFKAPTLRNIAKTAPYMHDGSIATLSEVLDHYAAGGRNVLDGPYAGDGRTSPVKSDLVPGFELSASEKADVIEFLESLTDDEFLTDPRYADPALDSVGGR